MFKERKVIILVVILFTTVIVAGGLVWYGQKYFTAPLAVNGNTNGAVVNTSVTSGAITPTQSEVMGGDSDVAYLCNSDPIITDMGSSIYPIHSKYKGINFLGQIFTAYNYCGTDRVNDIDGVEDSYYLSGLTIWLKISPSDELLKVFKDLGFQCDDRVDQLCDKWVIFDKIKLIDLLKLEPFYFYFKQDDCRNCG
ncbi:MAG: hypothetical protein HY974_02385 [Candidatus Kerfeldbacteria bacterium]|nr:hypothetical protein [Candidatus Kerfeldbacteria bacterium]